MFSIYIDEIESYCKTSFTLTSDNLKDSLPSGVYIFYDVSKEDSYRRDKKIILKGNYVNGVKDGLFEYKLYSKSKKLKFRLISIQNVSYVNGKKSGIDESYEIVDGSKYIPIHYGNYLNDMKNGIYIEYENGVVTTILLYKDDKVVERFLGREINRKMADNTIGIVVDE